MRLATLRCLRRRCSLSRQSCVSSMFVCDVRGFTGSVSTDFSELSSSPSSAQQQQRKHPQQKKRMRNTTTATSTTPMTITAIAQAGNPPSSFSSFLV
ncbi:hypothetical protein AGDE_13992 [Angomonas deanei]|nr:hypothetical protein AGDE_13992 [Angomonas deanei]|eukprot:EPY21568.1 hypothetical protein AGDE_13992 [Angomonas deanei]